MYTQILQMYTDAHKYKQKHTYRCENTQRYRHMNSPISPPVSLLDHTRESKKNEYVNQKHESWQGQGERACFGAANTHRFNS